MAGTSRPSGLRYPYMAPANFLTKQETFEGWDK